MTNIFKPALQLGDLRLGAGAFKGVYEEVEIEPTREQQVITPSAGKDAISKVTVGGVGLEETTVTPQAHSQIVKPSSGFLGLSAVMVEGVDTFAKYHIEVREDGNGDQIIDITDYVGQARDNYLLGQFTNNGELTLAIVRE